MSETQHHDCQVSVKFKSQLDTGLSTDVLRVSSALAMEELCSLLNAILSKCSRYLLYLNGEWINADPSRGLQDAMALQKLTAEDVLEILYIDEDDIAPEHTLSLCDTVVSLVHVGDRVIYMTHGGSVHELGRETPISPGRRAAGIFADKELYVFTETSVLNESGCVVFEAEEKIRCCAAHADWIAVACLNSMHLVSIRDGTARAVELTNEQSGMCFPSPCIRSIQMDSNAVAWIQGYDTIHVYFIEDGSRRVCRTGLGLTALGMSGDDVVCLSANSKVVQFNIRSGKMEMLDTPFRHLNVLQLDGPTAVCGSQKYIAYEKRSPETDRMLDSRIIPVRGQVNDFILADGLIYVAHDNFISTFGR